MLPRMPGTMSDIARDLKVSVVTVSKVLRNRGNISAATRARVLKRAKELNYQPNWIARSLVTRRTFTVGLLLPDFTHPFFAEVAKSIAETVRPHGYHVIISYFEEDSGIETKEAELLVARQVDGLIIASAQTSRTGFQRIRQGKIPLVLIDRQVPNVKAPFVGTDHRAIGRLATEHLIERGCRCIAHLRGPAIRIAADRLAGYRAALRAHRLSQSPQYVIPASYADSTGYEAMRKLLQVNPPPDGVFCYNDPVAIGAMKAIRDAGLSIPDDIAVVGAGNVHYSDVLAVPLTTVDQGAREIGHQAAQILIDQMEGSRKAGRDVLIPPKLVVRQSTSGRRTMQMPAFPSLHSVKDITAR